MSLLAFSGSAIQLVPDGTMLLHLVLIVVMVSLLNATLLRPINRIMEARERRTRGRFSEAQSVLAQVEEQLQGYERRLREARASGYRLLEEERAAALGERGRNVASVKVEVTQWRDTEKEKLKVAEADVRASLAKDARARAKEISGRILGRPIGLRKE